MPPRFGTTAPWRARARRGRPRSCGGRGRRSGRRGRPSRLAPPPALRRCCWFHVVAAAPGGGTSASDCYGVIETHHFRARCLGAAIALAAAENTQTPSVPTHTSIEDPRQRHAVDAPRANQSTKHNKTTHPAATAPPSSAPPPPRSSSSGPSKNRLKKPAWPTTSRPCGAAAHSETPGTPRGGPRRARREPAAVGAEPVAGRADSRDVEARIPCLDHRCVERPALAGSKREARASVCSDATIISTSSCVSAIFEAVCNARQRGLVTMMSNCRSEGRNASASWTRLAPRPPPSAPDPIMLAPHYLCRLL